MFYIQRYFFIALLDNNNIVTMIRNICNICEIHLSWTDIPTEPIGGTAGSIGFTPTSRDNSQVS